MDDLGVPPWLEGHLHIIGTFISFADELSIEIGPSHRLEIPQDASGRSADVAAPRPQHPLRIGPRWAGKAPISPGETWELSNETWGSNSWYWCCFFLGYMCVYTLHLYTDIDGFFPFWERCIYIYTYPSPTWLEVPYIIHGWIISFSLLLMVMDGYNTPCSEIPTLESHKLNADRGFNGTIGCATGKKETYRQVMDIFLGKSQKREFKKISLRPSIKPPNFWVPNFDPQPFQSHIWSTWIPQQVPRIPETAERKRPVSLARSCEVPKLPQVVASNKVTISGYHKLPCVEISFVAG